MENHAIRNKVLRRWIYKNLSQIIIKKVILDIEVRQGPMTNRGQNEERANSGHMDQKSKHLIVITTMLLMKTLSHKTSFVTLKRTIRASLILLLTHLHVMGRT
jgi:hypothetical protein